MQSGISASQELQTAFKALVTSSNKRGLICTINDEQLTPLAILEPATPSFDDDLSLLTPHVKSNVALFIILRRFELLSTAPFIAITYVPDLAPVRSKMLFASTRLTLVRELGVERFRETIFATTMEELTPDGFKKHDKHVKLVAPLTEEEKSLEEIKRREVDEGRGMAERKSHVMSGVHLSTSDEAMAALKRFAENSDTEENLVQLSIDTQTETLGLECSTSTPFSDLATTISSTSPRYSLYRFFHTYNNEKFSPILFIYTCPSASKIKERMLYAASSRSVQVLAGDAGIHIEKKIEEGNPIEITEEGLLADLHPTVEIKKGFDRPRRPGTSRTGW